MKLILTEEIKEEIVHYFDSNKSDYIFSTGNIFKISLAGKKYLCKIPSNNPFLYFRLARRLFRLDKSNAFFNYQQTSVIIIYKGKVFQYSLKNKEIKKISDLKQCRCVLHDSIVVTKDLIAFGEYGRNAKRKSVPIWQSNDDGETFNIACELDNIKHVHGIYSDSYSDSLWITTGDNDGECFLIEAQQSNFSRLVYYGDGSQSWRTVSLIFAKDKIVWIMDSPNIIPKLQSFDRVTGEIEEGHSFDAPVWYTKRFEDGSYLIQTSIEPGDAIKSSSSKVYFSEDYKNWKEVASFQKDNYPKVLFKFGVISFAAGIQSTDCFVISGEALRSIDGKSFICKIAR